MTLHIICDETYETAGLIGQSKRNNQCLYLKWQVSKISEQYGLWSFQVGGTNLKIFLHKNQYTHRKIIDSLVLD